MENFFDLPIDFDTMSSTPPFSLDDQDSQEGDLFEEITQGPHRRYLCSYSGCGKIFKFRSEITRHVIIHQSDRPYPCTYAGCKKNFKRADALENHIQTHAQVLPYACDIPGCDKKFATKAAIRYHKIKHDNNRVFKCGFPGCKRSFLTSSQLKQHEKSFNAHFRYSLFKVKDEEPIKFIKGEPQYLFQEFSMPIPKPASYLHWEIRGQDQEENNTEGSETENSSMIFTHLEQKNNFQQEEMQDCEQWAALFENKNQPQLQTSHSIESQQTSDSSRFFDSSEIKLLEFLKNQDHSGTSVL